MNANRSWRKIDESHENLNKVIRITKCTKEQLRAEEYDQWKKTKTKTNKQTKTGVSCRLSDIEDWINILKEIIMEITKSEQQGEKKSFSKWEKFKYPLGKN